MALRNQGQWGQAVTLPQSSESNVTSEFVVFDSGISLFEVPQIVTVTLDLVDCSGRDSLYETDDLWWAVFEVGLGGYRRKFETDWKNGQQVTFAAETLRVSVKRLSGALPAYDIQARASVAIGANASSGPAPTWTTPGILPTGQGVKIITPKHARDFALLGTPANFAAGLTIIQRGADPASFVTLTAAETRDLFLGRYRYPVAGQTQEFAADAPNTGRMRVVYTLDL